MLINSKAKTSSFFHLCTNPNGTYVIQKIIMFFSDKYRTKVNNMLLQNLLPLSLDIQGFCVVQKFISTCEDFSALYYITNTFAYNFCSVAKDQYGNYAFQCLVRRVNGIPELMNVISNGVIGNSKRTLSFTMYL